MYFTVMIKMGLMRENVGVSTEEFTMFKNQCIYGKWIFKFFLFFTFKHTDLPSLSVYPKILRVLTGYLAESMLMQTESKQKIFFCRNIRPPKKSLFRVTCLKKIRVGRKKPFFFFFDFFLLLEVHALIAHKRHHLLFRAWKAILRPKLVAPQKKANNISWMMV